MNRHVRRRTRPHSAPPHRDTEHRAHIPTRLRSCACVPHHANDKTHKELVRFACISVSVQLQHCPPRLDSRYIQHSALCLRTCGHKRKSARKKRRKIIDSALVGRRVNREMELRASMERKLFNHASSSERRPLISLPVDCRSASHTNVTPPLRALAKTAE
ncbi:hypothetical protein JYU34_005889 [Plutella xylostella]|uniref:Uncharacterized protein n=1 Tax=Plutella xylostella TaxID=51655 RepID=A0ABQ7QUF1_PLUXY|nr:hypothetical protein JYU34_005889 [Plutella xylostella]